jgi:hypothetical protein
VAWSVWRLQNGLWCLVVLYRYGLVLLLRYYEHMSKSSLHGSSLCTAYMMTEVEDTPFMASLWGTQRLLSTALGMQDLVLVLTAQGYIH